MRPGKFARGWLVSLSSLACLLACGSRTELLPGRTSAAGSGGMEPEPPLPECVTAQDCPQAPVDECGAAACIDGVCSLNVQRVCDDGNPCTADSCSANTCRFEDARVDADGDGAFARGNLADPNAALGCGTDCDDAAAGVFPGARELCDSFDNDCNGIVDDGTSLHPSPVAPSRVSPNGAISSNANGLAFDGEAFGASMTTNLGTWQGQFRRLDAQGKPLDDAQRVAHVNAESYGGPILWTGERYATAYADARQDDNYEVYFNVLNRDGQRLFEDLRVTNADDFSLSPSVAWTGSEMLLLWDDRRFEGSGDSSSIFGQRVSLNGELLGGNQRLSPAGTYAQGASMALSDTGIGIAFLSLEPDDRTLLRFMTTSRSFDLPSTPTVISFEDPDGVVVTAVGDKYVVTFHQYNSVLLGPAIFGVVLDRNGTVELGPLSMTAGAAHARGNATYSYGDRFVMVWADDKDGPYQLYTQTFDLKLAPLSPRLRLTNTKADTLGPAVAASADGGLGVLYSDESTGSRQTFFTRLDCVSSI